MGDLNMKKLSDTYRKLGIDFTFPIEVRNAHGKETYYENSKGYWRKSEYGAQGNRTYYEDSTGIKQGTPQSQSCDGKVIEIDGKKYKLKEL